MIEAFVKEMAALCQPDKVQWVHGTEKEHQLFLDQMVKEGVAVRLNDSLRPDSHLILSDPKDVARVEDKTFICSQEKINAGPTNNWMDPKKMKEKLNTLFSGCMQGRTMYVIPFCMGPLKSPQSKFGVQITDSPYVVVNSYHMTRIGDQALEAMGDKPFVPCMHSVGLPNKPDVKWPCNPENIVIAHFPRTREIWSFGSGYGGNALLGKKCFALRIASILARDEGWLAEHMLIMGITNPEGKKRYFCASFPSACGKTNLAMMTPTLPGWKVETVGDDIAWLKFGSDGRLYAINPEAGFFGVAPGTSYGSNPKAMDTLHKNALFTNVALTDEGDVWWEGMSDTPPKHLKNWLGNDWTPASEEKAAHPNARFTVSANQCPTIDPKWESPEGVPISGILFGGRRSTTIPLVFEALSWQHGTFIGASVSSEMTAAQVGTVGKLRHDPFAMLPFCGYNMADYFAHWLKLGKGGDPKKLPHIYSVNWFRKNSEGKFLWPGFGENSRVLKWIFGRCEGEFEGEKTPIGVIPKKGELDIDGLEVDRDELFKIHSHEWEQELSLMEEYFTKFGEKLPEGMKQEIQALKARI